MATQTDQVEGAESINNRNHSDNNSDQNNSNNNISNISNNNDSNHNNDDDNNDDAEPLQGSGAPMRAGGEDDLFVKGLFELQQSAQLRKEIESVIDRVAAKVQLLRQSEQVGGMNGKGHRWS